MSDIKETVTISLDRYNEYLELKKRKNTFIKEFFHVAYLGVPLRTEYRFNDEHITDELYLELRNIIKDLNDTNNSLLEQIVDRNSDIEKLERENKELFDKSIKRSLWQRILNK